MAKIGSWSGWQAMARDVSRTLYRLAVNENFAETEFTFKPYSPEVIATATMPLGSRTTIQGRFLDLGSIVFVAVEGVVEIAAGGIADSRLYLSLPFPYDPVHEGKYTFVVESASSHTASEYSGINGMLAGGSWIAIVQRDAGGNFDNYHTQYGDGVTFSLSGFYEKLPRYHFVSKPVPPMTFVPAADAALGFYEWTPVLAGGGSMTITNGGASYFFYKRDGREIRVMFELQTIEFGGSAANTMTMTLPFSTFNSGYVGTALITRSGTETLGVIAASAGSSVEIRNGVATAYPNFILGGGGTYYNITGNFIYGTD